MRILSVSVDNFGSYKNLYFEFDHKGLTLISGPTGSGKSTLCDIIPWVLFGKTSKNGSVNEVVSWEATAPTLGQILVSNNEQTFTIERSRNPNDLLFTDGLETVRGKDLNDTQRLINSFLGMTAETYLSASYYHEFSQTASFFSSTPSKRRDIINQVVDVSLANRLDDELSKARKQAKSDLTETQADLRVLDQQIKSDKQHLSEYKTLTATWKQRQSEVEKELLSRNGTFETTKKADIDRTGKMILAWTSDQRVACHDLTQQIDDLKKVATNEEAAVTEYNLLADSVNNHTKDKCHECGATKDGDALLQKREQLWKAKTKMLDSRQAKIDLTRCKAKLAKLVKNTHPYSEQLEEATNRIDDYEEKLAAMKKEKSPYTNNIRELTSRISLSSADKSLLEMNLLEITEDLSDFDVLTTLTQEYRGKTITDAITSLQDATNDLLTRYFDAELRVSMSLPEADSLDISLSKDGNDCVYTQLSKGQRCLLRLCFGISMMEHVANHQGVSTNCIFLDEFADGLSEELKIKSFRLLEHLATRYENVFCVEHSAELKARFINAYQVRLINGHSTIEET